MTKSTLLHNKTGF